ncbi:hypothetical protein EGW08_023315, partial [Elysia chlorotica]
IINGKDANISDWPWAVALQYVGTHVCGGGIIHPYFILTAAHCMRFVWLSLAILSSSSCPQVRRVIEYPNYSQFDGKDLALVELMTPLIYSQNVRPLCLPEPDDVFTRRSLCMLAGWGFTSGSDVLQQAKFSLVDTDLCNGTDMWNGAMAENERCAGYFNSFFAACS